MSCEGKVLTSFIRPKNFFFQAQHFIVFRFSRNFELWRSMIQRSHWHFLKNMHEKCQKMQKKMLNNAYFESKNMKNMLKSRDMVHNPDINQQNPCFPYLDDENRLTILIA